MKNIRATEDNMKIDKKKYKIVYTNYIRFNSYEEYEEYTEKMKAINPNTPATDLQEGDKNNGNKI